MMEQDVHEYGKEFHVALQHSFQVVDNYLFGVNGSHLKMIDLINYKVKPTETLLLS